MQCMWCCETLPDFSTSKGDRITVYNVQIKLCCIAFNEKSNQSRSNLSKKPKNDNSPTKQSMQRGTKVEGVKEAYICGIMSIPAEVLIYAVFKRLNDAERCTAASTCKLFSGYVHDNLGYRKIKATKDNLHAIISSKIVLKNTFIRVDRHSISREVMLMLARAGARKIILPDGYSLSSKAKKPPRGVVCSLAGIEYLDLGGYSISTEELAALVGIKHIKHLRFWGSLDVAGFEAISGVETMGLWHDVGNENLRALVGLKELEVWSHNQISDAGLIPLGEAGLTSLLLWRAEKITDACFESMTGLKKLSLKRLMNPNITDAIFPYLTNLQSLELEGCRSIRGDGLELLKNLKHISTDCNWGDDVFERLPGVNSVDIKDNLSITCKGIKALAKHGLSIISLKSCPRIKDEAITVLAGVQSVVLDSCDGISDVGIESLARNKSVTIRWCPGVTDKGLEHLASAEFISLGGENFTDKGVASLVAAKYIALYQTSVTSSCVTALRRKDIRVVDFTTTDSDSDDFWLSSASDTESI